MNLCTSENWTTTVINAIMNGPQWKNTAIFLTWDDWGGFYDHVPPPQIDRFGLGFRVPLIMISLYSNTDASITGRASSPRFCDSSRRIGGVSLLSERDAQAGDLSYLFAFSQSPGAPGPLPLRTDFQIAPPHPDQ